MEDDVVEQLERPGRCENLRQWPCQYQGQFFRKETHFLRFKKQPLSMPKGDVSCFDLELQWAVQRPFLMTFSHEQDCRLQD